MSRNWTRPCCVQEELTTSFTWGRRAIVRRWNCIAGFVQTRQKLRQENLSKRRDRRRRWRSFKVCSWLWSREREAWIWWQQVTESSPENIAGGEGSGYFSRQSVPVRREGRGFDSRRSSFDGRS